MLHLAPILAKINGADQESYELKKADDMEHVVLSLLASGKVTPGMAELVSKIGDMINNTMKPAVMTDHEAATSLIDQLFAAFNECQKQQNEGEKTAEESKLAANNASVAGAKCEDEKETLKGPADACKEGLPKLEELKDADCANVPSPKEPNSEVCTPTVADSYSTWVKRQHEYFENEINKYKAAKKKCNETTTDLDNKKNECDPITEADDGKQDECDNFADEKMHKMCDYYLAQKGVCDNHAQCFVDATKAYNDRKAIIEVQIVDRKVEWEALSRMQCLLGAFGTGADNTTDKEKISTCKAAEHDVSFLNITFHDLPEPGVCDVPDNFCDQTSTTTLPEPGVCKCQGYMPGAKGVCEGGQEVPCGAEKHCTDTETSLSFEDFQVRGCQVPMCSCITFQTTDDIKCSDGSTISCRDHPIPKNGEMCSTNEPFAKAAFLSGAASACKLPVCRCTNPEAGLGANSYTCNDATERSCGNDKTCNKGGEFNKDREDPCKAACMVSSTSWNGDGGGSSRFLDRHVIGVGNNVVNNCALRGFNMVRSGNRYRIKFECCEVPVQNSYAADTQWNGDGGGNIRFLDRHNVFCPQSNSALKSWQLIRNGNSIKFRMQCISLAVNTHSCHDVATQPSGNIHANALILDRHNINCGKADHIMAGWRLKTEGGKISILARCCQVR